MKKIRTSAIPSCSYYFYTHPHIHTYCPMYTHFFPFCYFLVFLFQHTHTRTYTLYVSDIHAYIHFIFKIFYAQVTYMHCYYTYYIFYKHVQLGDMEICATEKIFRWEEKTQVNDVLHIYICIYKYTPDSIFFSYIFTEAIFEGRVSQRFIHIFI